MSSSSHSVVVTGAGGGIGSAICRLLAAQGRQVVALDRDPEVLAELAAETGITAVVGDARDEQALAAARDQATSLGELTAWVSSVGVLAPARLHEVDDDHLETQLSINLEATVRGFRTALREFVARRTPGALLAIGSVHGIQPFPALPLYAAAKGAIEALVRQLCVDYAAEGIRANVVAPGAVRTLMTIGTDSTAIEESLRRAAALSPMNRVSEPEEIAAAVAYLLSDAALGVNGQVLRLDNGMSVTGANR